MNTRIILIFLLLGGVIPGTHLTTGAIEPQKKVSGIITDSTGKKLKGVDVLIKGTNTGTSTDAQGYYSIFTTATSTLVFSKKEMTPREIQVGQKTKIDVVLKGIPRSEKVPQKQ